ncbi:NUDIX domain-containing protein [Pelagibacterium limicola]|uniref:NUDIX domain-containing protein n=1 Tax=Pelagibacterium limicola TaxID=2791022 RepID=UPI0018AF7B07|nr:NUDIX domain-containing protein [Pelagibacterium limicola]
MKILFQGWNTLSRYEIALPGPEGTLDPHGREVADHGHAAVVLLIDREKKRITLVRQFRLPAHLNGDDGFLLEACAGLLDGDDPETCAKREAIEETGIALHTLIPVFDIYASPGSLTEKSHCFIGLYNETDRIGAGGGLAHEGEEIEIVEVPFADALNLIRSGSIVDAKTVALIQHALIEGFLDG